MGLEQDNAAKESPDDRFAEGRGGARRPGTALLTAGVVGLGGFAITQPLLDLLGRNPGFLLAHDLRGAALFAVVVTLALGPALLAVAPALFLRVLGLSPLSRAASQVGSRAGFTVALTLLSGLWWLLALRRLPMELPPIAALVLALLLAGALSALTLRRRSVAGFLAFTGVGVLVFPLVFLLRPQVRDLWRAATPAAEKLGQQADKGIEEVDAKTPVVLVVFDELPTSSLVTLDGEGEETIDSALFPTFADFASSATWYRRATTVADQTNYAVPAILSGRLPQRAGAATPKAYPQNLFSWLGGSYELRAVESSTALCAAEACLDLRPSVSVKTRALRLLADIAVVYGHLVLPRGLADDLPAIDGGWSGFVARGERGEESQPSDREVAAQAERFFNAIDGRRERVLYYLHLNVPHVPYKYLPSGREYGGVQTRIYPPGFDGKRWRDDDWLTVHAYQRHLLQVGYADRLLGELRARLQEAGVFDRALVIVTADHGVSFWPGGLRRELDKGQSPDILEVPLLVKMPGQQMGAIDDRPVQTIDILPTIAEVLGEHLPDRVASSDGQSLLLTGTRPHARAVDLVSGVLERKVISVDPAHRRRTIERKHQLFGLGVVGGVLGEGGSWDGMFRIGRHAQLIGMETAGLVDLRPGSDAPREPETEYSVTLLAPWQLEDVDTRSASLPLLVEGRIEPPPDQPIDLAISLRGTIVAVARSHPERVARDANSLGETPGESLGDASNTDKGQGVGGRSGQGEERFVVLLPETALEPGNNRPRIFEIFDSGDSDESLRLPRLRSLNASDQGPRPRLLQTSGGEVLEVEGQRLMLRPGMLEGEVKRGRVGIDGWSVHRSLRPFENLYVFDGEICLFAGKAARRHRRDLVQRFGTEDVLWSGFALELPGSILNAPEGVRVLVRRGDDIAELATPWRDAPVPRVRYRLETDAQGARLKSLLVDEVLPVVENGIQGRVERVVRRPGRPRRIVGWAREPEYGAVDHIIAVIDGESNHLWHQPVPRPDLEAMSGVETQNSESLSSESQGPESLRPGHLGFSIRVPKILLPVEGEVAIQVFAVTQSGHAVELPIGGR